MGLLVLDYKKIYHALVEKCKVRGLDKAVLEGYFEKHHIVPKCMGGSDEDDNFVLFTAREHVIAHKLLWKSYPDNYSLMWAYARTVNAHKGKGVLASREVEKLKLAKIEHMRNREISDETREKIRKTLTGHKRTRESVEKGRQKVIGQKRSEETRKLLSQRRQELIASGWTHPEEARKKIGDASRGKSISEEHKAKISAASKGRPLPEHVKQINSEYQKSLKPWEKSAVKARKERAKVWLEADSSYSVWVENDKPGSWAFSSILSNIHGFEYKTYHFETLIKLFKSGWEPSNDPDWLEWKSSMEA